MSYDQIENLNQLDPALPTHGATLDDVLASLRQCRGMLKNILLKAHNADGSLKSGVLGTAADNSVSTASLQAESVTLAKLETTLKTMVQDPTPGAKKVTGAMLADNLLASRMFPNNCVPLAALAGFITSNYIASSATVDATRAIGADHLKDQAVTNRVVKDVSVGKLTGGDDNSLLMKLAGFWTPVNLAGGLTYNPTTNEFDTTLKFSAAVLTDAKARGTAGGNATTDTWITRSIGELSDPDALVTISANKCKLKVGTYLIYVCCPAYQVGRHQTRLRETTNDIVVLWGSSEESKAASGVVTNSVMIGAFVVTDADLEFEIEHWVQTAVGANDFGLASTSNNGTVYSGHSEVYTQAFLLKIG